MSVETDSEGHPFEGFAEFEFTKRGCAIPFLQKFMRAIGSAPPSAGQTAYNYAHRFRIELEASADATDILEVDLRTVAEKRAMDKRRGSMNKRRQSFSKTNTGGGGGEAQPSAEQPAADSEPPAAK